MSKKLVVWLNVDPAKEESFNQWYQDDYIPRFVQQIPGIIHVSRWNVPGTQTYLTIYELDPETTEAALMAALKNPARQAERDEWNEWEHAFLSDFRDGFFEQTFSYTP